MADIFSMYRLNSNFTPVEKLIEGNGRSSMIAASRNLFAHKPEENTDGYFYILNHNWDDGGCMFINDHGRLIYYPMVAQLRERIVKQIELFKLLTR